MVNHAHDQSGCCIGRDGTGFESECTFMYSDIMVNIRQVIIQKKNHLKIIQITKFK